LPEIPEFNFQGKHKIQGFNFAHATRLSILIGPTLSCILVLEISTILAGEAWFGHIGFWLLIFAVITLAATIPIIVYSRIISLLYKKYLVRNFSLYHAVGTATFALVSLMLDSKPKCNTQQLCWECNGTKI